MLREHARKRLTKKAKKGFRGFPVATVAFYGPDNRRASKLTVGIVLAENQEAVELKQWFAEQGDVREDVQAAEEVLAYMDRFGVRSVAMVDRIIGCPHEEGIDYHGPTCPLCPTGPGVIAGAGRGSTNGRGEHYGYCPRPTGGLANVVEAYQALRGVALLTAVTFVAEIGDVRRFESPRQLMAYLGLVPYESSTGERVRRGSITKAGNPRVRRVLIEGAWTYRFPARMSRLLQERQEGLPKTVRAIAWKAQVRLCARYRRLMAAGKRQTVVTTAIAREMAAFLWAVGREIQPRSAA